MATEPKKRPSAPSFFRTRLRWIMCWLAFGIFAWVVAWTQAPRSDALQFQNAPILEWVMYPMERNPHLRLPVITSELRSVATATKGTVSLAVGYGGTIFRSSDGHSTWQEVLRDRDRRFVSVAISAKEEIAMVLDEGGAILISNDGGISWTATETGYEYVHNAIALSADGSVGVIGTSEGRMLRTSDGGTSWEGYRTGHGGDLRSIAIAAEGTKVVAVGSVGALLLSTDEHNNWTARNNASLLSLTSVALSEDGRIGVAVGPEGTVLKTADGGEDWSPRISGTAEHLNAVSLSSDGSVGVATGRNGVVLLSTDGGDTWEALPRASTQDLNAVALRDGGGSGLMVGAGGEILWTGDAGTSWQYRSAGTVEDFRSIAVHPDGLTGLIVGNSTIVFRSDDSGQSWNPVPTGATNPLHAVSFAADGRTAFAVGSAGTIIMSVDGGASWTDEIRVGQQNLNGVAASSDGWTGLAVGAHGVILKTVDGGETWDERVSKTPFELKSVSVSADGQTAVAVGGIGTLLWSEDGGEEWSARRTDTQEPLAAVSMRADGQAGLTVGATGTVLKTVDGGRTWEERESPTSADLVAVVIGPGDGRIALTGTSKGEIFRSVNGGDTWDLVENAGPLAALALSHDGQTALGAGLGNILLGTVGGREWQTLNSADHYQILPAVWFWIFLACSPLVLLPTVRPPPPVMAPGVSQHLMSDRPIEEGDPDPLQRRPIGNVLSRFLRNRDTEPPLTVAITGNWGEGKSSLMKLVQADLRRSGARTVWFNAWHHQKEQHLFAALLQSVREQAIPPLWCGAGVRFRGRLWLRGPRPLWFGSAAALAALSLAMVAYWDALAATFVTALSPLLPDYLPSNYPDWVKGLGVVLSVGLGVFTGYRGWTADLMRSGVNPGRLMAAASGTFRVKAFGDQLAFRHRFGAAFKEVTEALEPDTLVILIDDLDRCRPEQVVETLEAVSFLVSAGRCHIIMGIAPDQVMYCVGLGFREIAAEMAAPPENVYDSAKQAREVRREYAQNYLKKLINIEVPIPPLTDAAARRLTDVVPPTDHRANGRDFIRLYLGPLAITVVLAAALGAAGLAVFDMNPEVKVMPLRVVEPPPVSAQNPALSVSPMEALPRETPSGFGDPRINPVELLREGDTAATSGQWILLPGSFALMIGLAWMFLRDRRRERRVHDSPAFQAALNIWCPLVHIRTRSPRELKRFTNRVRYVAMSMTVALEGTEDKPSESLVVALAALQNAGWGTQTDGDERFALEAMVMQLGRDALPESSASTIRNWLSKSSIVHETDHSEITAALKAAVVQHRERFPDEVVSADMVEQFCAVSAGIIVR